MEGKCRHCGREFEGHRSGLCDSCETQARYDRHASYVEVPIAELKRIIEAVDGLVLDGEDESSEMAVAVARDVLVLNGRLPIGVRYENLPVSYERFVPPLKVGDKIKLRQDVERYPHFIAPEGMTGTIVGIFEEVDGPLVCARMDEILPGAEEWDNEIQWTEYDHILEDVEVVR